MKISAICILLTIYSSFLISSISARQCNGTCALGARCLPFHKLKKRLFNIVDELGGVVNNSNPTDALKISGISCIEDLTLCSRPEVIGSCGMYKACVSGNSSGIFELDDSLISCDACGSLTPSPGLNSVIIGDNHDLIFHDSNCGSEYCYFNIYLYENDTDIVSAFQFTCHPYKVSGTGSPAEFVYITGGIQIKCPSHEVNGNLSATLRANNKHNICYCCSTTTCAANGLMNGLYNLLNMFGATSGSTDSGNSMATTTTISTSLSGQCTTISGNVPNAACVFPFTFQGKEYRKCTTLGAFSPWCSTQTDNSGKHVPGQWGNCNPHTCGR